MDRQLPSRPGHAASGGTVEPANRAPVAKERFQTPTTRRGERYELRDPFAEVTYRAKTFDEMVAKADQLGAMRFNAIDAEGKRTPVRQGRRRVATTAAAPIAGPHRAGLGDEIADAGNARAPPCRSPTAPRQSRRRSPRSTPRRSGPRASHGSKRR